MPGTAGVEVPSGLAAATEQREGPAGRAWLARLPGLVGTTLAGRGLSVDGVPTHGEVALVLPVRRGDTPAVLKTSFPHPGNLGEGPVLRHLAGRGAVRLLESSADGMTLLLERAGPTGLDSVATAADSIEVCGRLARRLAVPAADSTPSLAATTDGWLAELEQQVAATPGALAPRALQRARETIAHLAADPTPTVVHGDLHPGNVLAAEREPWLAIDPKGWRGTAAYDAFTAIAVRRDELDPDRLGPALAQRIGQFARAADVDPELARACCQARAVSSYLYQLLRSGSWFDLELLRRLTEL